MEEKTRIVVSVLAGEISPVQNITHGCVHLAASVASEL
jgi:hypothetical protein